MSNQDLDYYIAQLIPEAKLTELLKCKEIEKLDELIERIADLESILSSIDITPKIEYA